MFHSSKIEISRSALKQNVDFIRRIIGPDVIFASVVKGNAYGHGINLFVPLAESVGIRDFAVFSADEALKVLNARTERSSIMIMGAIDPGQLAWAIEQKISFYVFELERLREAVRIAEKMKKPARIHLELETGMNRTGLEGKELREAAGIIKRAGDAVRFEGLCTHLAGAESSSNYLRIRQQIATYHEQEKWLANQGLIPLRKHIASSAATFTYPETRLDLVRIGILQYGYWPTPETKMHYLLNYPQNGNNDKGKSAEHRRAVRKIPDPLKRIIRWSSRIMSVKTVGPGEFVGYGTIYLTTRKQKIATVPIGYFHGFTRSLSNLGKVLVHGKRVQVIGTVNMNMLLIDVTDHPSVKVGDEVVMIGKQKKMTISVTSFAELTPFLNYEVLVRLPSEIPREIVD
jgi:alanine racemase